MFGIFEFPPVSPQRLPFTARIILDASHQQQPFSSTHEFGKWCENVSGEVYAKAGWKILTRRLRGPGCEIDLAVAKGDIGRVIEVKGRSKFTEDFSLSAFREIYTKKKRRTLERGIDLLHQRLICADRPKNWTAELLILTPEKNGHSCIIQLWPDLFSY